MFTVTRHKVVWNLKVLGKSGITILTDFVKNCLANFFNYPKNKIKENVCYSDPLGTKESNQRQTSS